VPQKNAAKCAFGWNGPRSGWPQQPRGPRGLSKGFPPKAAAHIVRSGTRNLDDNASGARPGAWPPDEKVFQDFPIVCGGKWLSANITMNQVIYDLCARTHAHHLVVRLTLWALKLLIVVHRRADIQITDAVQATLSST
jgi:hypothetical protein